MQCLFCGKGIGPIRQLRDLEFCSDSHRHQFKERYRQRLYEALAPEPAPTRLAEFLERAAVSAGPALHAELRVLATSLPSERIPSMTVDAAGISVKRPGVVLGHDIAAMPTQPVWHRLTVAYPIPLATASSEELAQNGASAPLKSAELLSCMAAREGAPLCAFRMDIDRPQRSAAGAAPAGPEAARPEARPLAAVECITGPVRFIPESARLPLAARAFAPTQAGPSSPELMAAVPVCAEPAFEEVAQNGSPRAASVRGVRSRMAAREGAPLCASFGPVAHAVHEAAQLPPNRSIAAPSAPGADPLAETRFSAAEMISEPRPMEAGPLALRHETAAAERGLPVVFEAQGTRSVGIFLPKPPALAASSIGMAEPRIAQPQLRLPAPQLATLAGAVTAGCIAPAVADIPTVSPVTSAQLAAPRAALPHPGLPARTPELVQGTAAHVQPALPAVGPAEFAQPLTKPLAAQPEPRLPAAAAAMLPGIARAHCIQPALPLMEAGAPAAAAAANDPLTARLGAASPVWLAERNASPFGPLGEHVNPRVACDAAIAGAPAAAALPAGFLHAACGNLNPVCADRTPSAHIETPVPQTELAILPAVMGSAPAREMAEPAPAVPVAAAPSWDAVPAAQLEHSLVPRADMALPPIDCMPSPAGALAALNGALPPSVGRSLRSCAVLWTLRVMRICHPPFLLDPVRVKFNELVRPDAALLYRQDLEDELPTKLNVRAIKRLGAPPKRKIKWQYAGLAAAAMLMAGVLTQVAPKSLAASARWHGVNVRQWVSKRATRSFADDFRTGLGQWKGLQAKWPKSWSYSTDGFMHPGQLALYRPSVPLSDYRFEFMAQIENKSVDWVVRAHDANNYYALKFTVVQPGPRPMVAMVRYPVIGGSKGERVETPLRMMIHANTPYRVTVDVKGNHYRTYVEGQEADFWTEDRLKTGGVGFFSEAGERARVYWVKLESHGDILGRICGLLSGKGGDAATDKEKEAMDYRHAGTTELNGGSGLGGREAAAATAQEARISRVLSKAASLHLDGKLDEAARELVRALDGGEHHPALYFALGQLQYELQEYGPAAASYGQTALLQPLHPTAHFNAGVCLGRIERWEDAAASFRKAISNDPARAEAHLALGACLVQLGLHNEALDAYDRFLEHHPDNDEALFGKAVALQKRDRGSEAVELYKRILTRNPHSEEALSNLISLALSHQDYEQVRKYSEKLVAAQPKSQIALEGLAGAAFAAGDHAAAAEYSRRLAELAPQAFENWFNLGVACHKAGDLGNAADAYARATRVQPNSPQAHLNLGVALQEQGDLKGARAAYQTALEIDPKLPGVHWNLGLVHEQLGDADGAEKLYAQVPEDSPDSDDAAFRIGHLRLQRADYAGSIQAFESCLAKRGNWPEARLNLGIAHWRSGDKEAARTCFQELTAAGVESKEALRGLAALSLEHGDYDKAFEIYRQLLDAGERSPELLYNAGLICQRRGEPEDAAVLYREALKADPQFGEALLNLGHALMSLGNEFEARSCWRKAVIAKPELAQRYFEPARA